jgi:hypothetical protein
VVRNGVAESLGASTYFGELDSAWESFKEGGAIPGVELEIGDGMNSFMKGWDNLALEKVPPSKSLVYRV